MPSTTTLLLTGFCILLMLAMLQRMRHQLLPNVFDFLGNIVILVIAAYVLRL